VIALHLAVLLFGAAALVAQATSLSPLALTLGRCLVAAPVLLLLAWRDPVRGSGRALGRAVDLPQLVLAGPLLALHWVAFFQSMRLGGVPVALLSYASFPAFSLLLQHVRPAAPSAGPAPSLRRSLVQLGLLAAGLLVLAGPLDPASPGRGAALAWGLLAGACFALLARWNSGRVTRLGAMRLAAGQLAGAALLLLPWSWHELAQAGAGDWGRLATLGLACTALGHGLFIHALRRVSPFQAGLAAGLEPVYGLLLAALLGAGVLPREWAALPLVLAAALPLPAGWRRTGRRAS